MNPTHPEFLDLEECEPCDLHHDVPMDPLGEMCQNVRGANGPVKNEQAKARRTNNKKKNKKKGANKRAASASAEEAEDVVKKAKHVQPDEWVAAELCRCSVEQWVEYSWKEKERRLLAELWEYAEDCDLHLFEDEPKDEMSEASLLADECCEHTIDGEDIQQSVASVQYVGDETRTLKEGGTKTVWHYNVAINGCIYPVCIDDKGEKVNTKSSFLNNNDMVANVTQAMLAAYTFDLVTIISVYSSCFFSCSGFRSGPDLKIRKYSFGRGSSLLA